MVLLAMVGALFASTPVARAACYGHCYAIAQYFNYNEFGASSTFQTVHLFSPNNGVDHISEEVWLIDDKKSCNVGGANWVAAGEATWVGHTGNWYF